MSEKMRLKGKVALITGAGRGIGQALTLRFAEEGCDVAVNDISEGNLKDTLEKIKECGVAAMPAVFDVSKYDEVKDAVNYVFDKFGKIDILINNAGISKIAPLEATTDEIWDSTIDINLKGTFNCMKAVLPLMAQRGYGKVINMSSQSGMQGNAQYSAYCASKFGIRGLTQALAIEYAKHKININALCPGVVLTPLWEDMIADYAKKRDMPVEEVPAYLASKIPLKRLCEPDDVANAALFLASDEASYITGQSINISGGAIMS